MRIVIDLQGAQSASRFRGIGRYSLALALGMARNAGGHELWIALSGALPDAIGPLRQAFAGLLPPERIVVFDVATPAAEHLDGRSWRVRADELMREYVLAQLRPDMLLVTSLFEGYVDDAVTSIGAFVGAERCATVLYDLIPFLQPALYLGSDTQRRHYQAKIDSLRRAGLLLAISDYSRQEAVEALALDPARVVAISTAVDARFHPAAIAPTALAALQQRFGISRPFIMYAPGGFDARKNIDGLVKAVGLLAPALRAQYQVLIASKPDHGQADHLRQLAARSGLAADALLLSGYVDDDTLIALYRACALFVFPSRHEGFGLPALEAMACGALVIGGDNTSLPEVIGCDEAMFNADDPAAIAERIGAVLGEPALQARLRAHGLRQAARFSWDASAQRALRALEHRHAALDAAPDAAPARGKRRLAFISPLPPERTGIADYAAQVLPALAEHFDITLVLHQDEAALAPALAGLARHDLAWFGANAAGFDQLIYQFGNSPYHSHMFALLAAHPGVVVLHDFYLSSVLAYEQMTGAMPRGFTDALYHSHGYHALALAQADPEAAKRDFPCNLAVLQQASAVIVHSAHALTLARQWYGPQAGGNWHVVPLPRSAPLAGTREAARAALGIGANAFVVCSFGFIDASKLSDVLLQAWRDSSLAADRQCELVFVGANHGGDFGLRLQAAIEAAGCGRRIRIAGWTDEAFYHQYLRAADVGVQLRGASRGETSAAVLDCMNYGLATIVNANGAMAALPADAVWRLDDAFAPAALVAALETLRADQPRRADLGARAAAHLAGAQRPAHSARLYAQVLDQVWQARGEAMPALLAQLGPLLPHGDEQALQQIAHCLAFAPQAGPQPRQLLVDVTNIVRRDLGTGIERVVRMQSLALLRQRASGFRVEPVYLSNQGGRCHYRYAQQYACALLGIDPVTHADCAIDINPGDVLYAPDYAPLATIEAAHAGLYDALRARGVRLNFLIHDLLPVLQPQFFPPGADGPHAEWLACIGRHADRLICISQAVADEARAWFGDALQAPLAVLHHGAELDVHSDAAPAAPEAGAVLAQLAAAPSFLMVGTIEPRKGHLQALAAFEQLWRDGVDVKLVIVGHEGWRGLADSERRTIPQAVRQIGDHPQLGKRLFWLKGIDDAYLQRIYRACACLLAASEGEGFGLPLIEAAHYGLPVIARDIAVFREVAGNTAWYFDGAEPAALATALRAWLALRARGAHPAPAPARGRSWRENADDLLAMLETRDA